eukprot:SAG22_NODE_201_length_15391_cov_7.662176_5_plen_163_part_00
MLLLLLLLLLLLCRIVYENGRAYPEYLVRYYRGPYDQSRVRGPQTRPANASKVPISPPKFKAPAPAPAAARGQARDQCMYVSINPQGGEDPYDAADNARISAAEIAGEKYVRLFKPYGTFEIRFGDYATSDKMRTPPKSSMIQVNMSNGNTRVVRHASGKRP